MENTTVKITVSDYRTFLALYDKSSSRKIQSTGPDLPSVLPLFCDEISRVALPTTVLLSVCVPSAEDIPACDISALLQIAVGNPNHSSNIIWGLKEKPEHFDVCVTAYLGYKSSKWGVLFFYLSISWYMVDSHCVPKIVFDKGWGMFVQIGEVEIETRVFHRE